MRWSRIVRQLDGMYHNNETLIWLDYNLLSKDDHKTNLQVTKSTMK